MRSLYIEDIPGARPKKHVYPKELYRLKHEQEITRFSKKNPEEKRIFEWYRPTLKPTEPLERNDDLQWSIKRTLRKSLDHSDEGMTKSIPSTQLLRRNSLNQSQVGPNRSMLLESGRSSLSMSGSLPHEDPYFPHRYTQKAMGETNKWSGSRQWQGETTKVVSLPPVQEAYFRKW